MRPVHKKKKLRRLIKAGQVQIKRRAVDEVHDLRWSNEDILSAILQLDRNDCFDSQKMDGNPEVWYDYYRTTKKIHGEYIYTHFYIEDDWLVIDSMKRRFP